MKKLNFYKYLLIVLIATLSMSFKGETDSINAAFKNGDVSVLTLNMNETVELVILEKENIYSKTQAEQILKRFFSNHKPVGFEVLHNGGSKNSQYYIGSLKTEKGTFRVYYLLKNKDGKSRIFQLRIENDE